jgi:hypothetical protein
LVSVGVLVTPTRPSKQLTKLKFGAVEWIIPPWNSQSRKLTGPVPAVARKLSSSLAGIENLVNRQFTLGMGAWLGIAVTTEPPVVFCQFVPGLSWTVLYSTIQTSCVGVPMEYSCAPEFRVSAGTEGALVVA